MYVINLTEDERAALTEIMTRKRVLAQKRRRAHILLLADEGWTDEEIADRVEAGVRTVERVRQRCCERGLKASLDRKRQENPSRPRTFDGAAEARLVALACSEPPEGRARWTLTLLADKLVELEVVESVSRTTVHRTLKKTKSSPGG